MTEACSATVFAVVPPETSTVLIAVPSISDARCFSCGIAAAIASIALRPSSGRFPACAGTPWKSTRTVLDPFRALTKLPSGRPGSKMKAAGTPRDASRRNSACSRGVISSAGVSTTLRERRSFTAAGRPDAIAAMAASPERSSATPGPKARPSSILKG